MDNYFKSEKHLENVKKAGILGNKKIKELTDKRKYNYYLKPTLCKQCNGVLNYEKRHNNFCNSSCAAIYNNKNRDISFVTEEFRQKHRDIAIENNKKKYGNDYISLYDNSKFCPICNKELTYNQKISKNIYCSNLCRSKNVSDETNDKIRKKQLEHVKNGTHTGWLTRNIISYPEKFFITILENNNLNYKHNFVVNKKDLGLNDVSNYFLDFYFIDKKIDLEIDGKQHNYSERKEKDKIRDDLLKKIGIKVYRIKWKNPINDKNKEYIKDEINNFLQYYNNN